MYVMIFNYDINDNVPIVGDTAEAVYEASLKVRDTMKGWSTKQHLHTYLEKRTELEKCTENVFIVKVYDEEGFEDSVGVIRKALVAGSVS